MKQAEYIYFYTIDIVSFGGVLKSLYSVDCKQISYMIFSGILKTCKKDNFNASYK